MKRYPFPVTVWMKRGSSASSFRTDRIFRMAPLMLLSYRGRPFPPNPLDNLLAADKLPPLIDQKNQNFHRDALQLERTASPAQRVGLCVELEILSKPDGF